MTARRAGPLAAALAAVTVVLAVVLVTWAASIGPDDVLRGAGGRSTASASPDTPTPQRPPRQKPPAPAKDTGAVQDVVRVLAAVVYVVVAACGVFALYLLLRRRRRRGPRERPAFATGAPPDDEPFDVLDPAAAVGSGLLADADDQRDELASGPPRNAIVACWHRFELTAAEAGLERHRWETSAEYTIRVLDLVDAEASAVSRLAGLYREARFSEHEITEADRAAALEAFDAIHRSLRRHAAGWMR